MRKKPNKALPASAWYDGFRARLRQMRVASKQSQADMGKLLGGSQGTVTRIETGKILLLPVEVIANLKGYCEAHHFSLTWLLTGVGEMRPNEFPSNVVLQDVKQVLTGLVNHIGGMDDDHPVCHTPIRMLKHFAAFLAWERQFYDKSVD